VQQADSFIHDINIVKLMFAMEKQELSKTIPTSISILERFLEDPLDIKKTVGSAEWVFLSYLPFYKRLHHKKGDSHLHSLIHMFFYGKYIDMFKQRWHRELQKRASAA